MALLKCFDPSKQFKVVKGFYEGGRKYSEGDAYVPRTSIGKSKVLFRHYIAGRVEPVEEVKKEIVTEPVEEKPVEETAGESKEAPKKRSRKRKSTDS